MLQKIIKCVMSFLQFLRNLVFIDVGYIILFLYSLYNFYEPNSWKSMYNSFPPSLQKNYKKFSYEKIIRIKTNEK